MFHKSQTKSARWQWNRAHNSQAVAEDPLPVITHLGLLQHHQQVDFSKTHVWTVLLQICQKNI